MLKREKIKKIKEVFKKLPRGLAENAFLTFLVLFFLALILGGLLFYQYSILAQEKRPKVLEVPLPFNEKVFQDILQIWQERQKKFEEKEPKEPPNPFIII